MKKQIGLLYSLSGTIGIVGQGQLNASLLAIEEINKLSQIKFEPIVRDAKSSPAIAANEAYNLFKESKVDAIVGCYMSSVRNSVISVLNETGGLLIYPTVYEGEQVHPNIFYLGAVPNQQIEPLLSWTIQNLSNNFVLVGSDYIYPRSINRQVKQWIECSGGKVHLETYFPLDCKNFDVFFQKFNNMRKICDSFVIFSTIVGNSAVSFYKKYKEKKIPFSIISPITSENEIQRIGKEASCGHICTSAYFETVETERNKKFVRAFKKRFGEQPIGREMSVSYDAIHLLANAYNRLSSICWGHNDVEKIRMSLKNLSFESLQGNVFIDGKTQHMWQWSRIGKISPEGQIQTIWKSPGPVPPKLNTNQFAITLTDNLDFKRSGDFGALVGANNNFLECIHLAKIAAMTSSSVLITGETGTGKELFARAIHESSPRHAYPFVPINCATIPRDLIGSELFGYEEGSFTGAKRGGKAGKFELANGGTLFLDEIGDMPNDMQAHLLRAIEESEIYRIGGTDPVRLNVRLIASTNKDLSREITQGGSFRKDLFYRLSVFHINLPNLCDRKDDISILANHFLRLHCCENGIKKKLTPKTLEILENHVWPGNVRELKNVIERSFYLSMDTRDILPNHLPDYIINPRLPKNERYGCLLPNDDDHTKSLTNSQRTPNCIRSMQDTEKDHIRETLKHSRYNVSRSATLLGISRTTLYRKMKKYNIHY